MRRSDSTWDICSCLSLGGGDFPQAVHTRHTHLCVELCLHISLDPQHLPECVLVAMTNLKLLPRLPARLGSPGVTHLRATTEDPSGPVYLPQLHLQLSVLHTHLSEGENRF